MVGLVRAECWQQGYVPLLFPSLTGWWSMRQHASQTDGTDLTSFTDLSGNGRHWDQRAAGAYPDKQTISGYPAADFNGSDESMDEAASLSTMIGATGLCAIVCQMTANPTFGKTDWYGNHGVITDAIGYWGIAARFSGGQAQWQTGIYDGTNGNIELNTTAGNRDVVMIRRDGGTFYASLNGGTESSIARGAPSTTTGVLELGVNYNDAAWFNGRIYEAVTSTGNGSSGDRANLVAFLKARWGIA